MTTGEYIVVVGQRIQQAENDGNRDEVLRLTVLLRDTLNGQIEKIERPEPTTSEEEK